MYCGLARNKRDIEQAIDLSIGIFRADEEENQAKNIKISMMSVGKSVLKLDDLIVLVKEGYGVIGVCFIKDRLLYKDDSLIKASFLSSICISNKFRGYGYSKLLMDQVIKECYSRQSEIALLISRKNVDHYYNKFNFWGISQYNKIQVNINDDIDSSHSLKIISASALDLNDISSVYKNTYSKLYGSCIRTIDYWNYILWKTKELNYSFITIKSNDDFYAYAVLSDSDIYEFAYKDEVNVKALVQKIAHYTSSSKLNFHCSLEHSLAKELKGYDFTCSQRECMYGGHMVKLINPGQFLEEESVHDSQVKSHKNFSYESTCHFLGISMLSEKNVKGGRPFNILMMDQY